MFPRHIAWDSLIYSIDLVFIISSALISFLLSHVSPARLPSHVLTCPPQVLLSRRLTTALSPPSCRCATITIISLACHPPITDCVAVALLLQPAPKIQRKSQSRSPPATRPCPRLPTFPAQPHPARLQHAPSLEQSLSHGLCHVISVPISVPGV